MITKESSPWSWHTQETQVGDQEVGRRKGVERSISDYQMISSHELILKSLILTFQLSVGLSKVLRRVWQADPRAQLSNQSIPLKNTFGSPEPGKEGPKLAENPIMGDLSARVSTWCRLVGDRRVSRSWRLGNHMVETDRTVTGSTHRGMSRTRSSRVM